MRSRGFTLLEALVAVGVILLLVVAMTSVISDIADARERTRSRGDRQQGTTAAFELLSRAADTCLTIDENGSAGIQGGPLQLSITRSEVAARRLNQTEGAKSPLGDRQKLELGIEGQELVVNGEEPNTRSALIKDVFAIRFRYHDGEGWLGRWDSSISGLPRAIELSIWMAPWPEGQWPSWLPQEGTEESEDFNVTEDVPVVAEEVDSFGETPPPDMQRIVAIFDPAGIGEAIDVISTESEDFFEEIQQ